MLLHVLEGIGINPPTHFDRRLGEILRESLNGGEYGRYRDGLLVSDRHAGFGRPLVRSQCSIQVGRGILERVAPLKQRDKRQSHRRAAAFPPEINKMVPATMQAHGTESIAIPTTPTTNPLTMNPYASQRDETDSPTEYECLTIVVRYYVAVFSSVMRMRYPNATAIRAAVLMVTFRP